MSLRARLTAAICALVFVTLFGAWALTGRLVLRPFAGQVFRGYLDQVVHVAERLEEGERPRELEAQLGLHIRPMPTYDGDGTLEAPGGRRRGPRDMVLTQDEHRGRRVHYGKARQSVLVETDRGWVMVRRELDLQKPTRRLLPVLLILGVGVIAGAGVLSVRAIRPLTTARDAMERIAGGELDHRLDEGGPPELADAARSFNHMADRVNSMMRADREMLAGVSHELRTPLTRLRLEVELLRELGPSASRLDAMEADLAELDALVGHLTELSRMQLGAIELQLEPVDLTQLCAGLAGDGVRVEGDGGVVIGDRVLLERAVGNLLQNAARYAPGHPAVVRLEPGRVQVQDQGPGVPEDQLAGLFQPFVRGESSHARHTGGLGLGLMIVHQVAALHGGRAHAANRSAGGLVVTLDVRAALAGPG